MGSELEPAQICADFGLIGRSPSRLPRIRHLRTRPYRPRTNGKAGSIRVAGRLAYAPRALCLAQAKYMSYGVFFPAGSASRSLFTCVLIVLSGCVWAAMLDSENPRDSRIARTVPASPIPELVGQSGCRRQRRHKLRARRRAARRARRRTRRADVRNSSAGYRRLVGWLPTATPRSRWSRSRVPGSFGRCLVGRWRRRAPSAARPAGARIASVSARSGHDLTPVTRCASLPTMPP